MYSTAIFFDNWTGAQNDEAEEVLHSVDRLEEIVRLLDQRRHTMLTLEAANGAHLSVGGGNGEYVVFATFDGETFFNLTSGGLEDGTRELVAGGQLGEFPSRTIVDLETAAAAAVTFARDGKLDESLTWERQD